MKGIDLTGLAYMTAIGIAGYLLYKLFTDGPTAINDAVDIVKEKAGELVDAVNPANAGNLVNQAASAGIEALTGEKGATVGSKLADLIQPDAWSLVNATGPTKYISAGEADQQIAEQQLAMKPAYGVAPYFGKYAK